jgi:hypothetical protein
MQGLIQVNNKDETIPVTDLGGRKVVGPPIGSQKAVMSVLRAGRQLFTPMKIPGTDFFQTLSRLQSYSAAGRIRLTQTSSDLMGNRTHDLLVSSIVPQPITLPRTL